MILDFSIGKNSSYLKNKKLSMLIEKEIKKTLGLIHPRRKMIDIGACEGYWSILLSVSFDKILAFETIPFNYQILKNNSKNIQNIKTFNFSLSDIKEDYQMIGFEKPTDPYTCDKSMRLEYYKNEMQNKHKISENLVDKILKHQLAKIFDVMSIVFDDEFENENDIDFLNIDVVGDELKVLHGLIQTIDKTKAFIRVVTENQNVDRFMHDIGYIKTAMNYLWQHKEPRSILI